MGLSPPVVLPTARTVQEASNATPLVAPSPNVGLDTTRSKGIWIATPVHLATLVPSKTSPKSLFVPWEPTVLGTRPLARTVPVDITVLPPLLQHVTFVLWAHTALAPSHHALSVRRDMLVLSIQQPLSNPALLALIPLLEVPTARPVPQVISVHTQMLPL
jgi:hypothetical protein